MKRKHSIIAFVSAILLFTSLSGQPQLMAQDLSRMEVLAGTWLGRIEAGALYLRLVFNISLNEQDSLKASLESPDQGSAIIPMGTVLVEGDSVKINARLLGATYRGVIKEGNRLEGMWEQLGQGYQLNMEKQDKPFKLNRPQEPVPPFPYRTEEVRFTNEKEGFQLAGTLSFPEGEGPFPGAVLISGSGQQNRDEELMGHKPFAVIADYLTRRGVAVLRYDDRGVGQSQGKVAGMTSADFALDALAAFSYLTEHPQIDKNRSGFIGHSEGSLIASIVAASDKNVAWVVSLAGTGVDGELITLTQAEEISLAMGNSPEDVATARGINTKLYKVIRKTADYSKAEAKLTKKLRKELVKADVQDEVIEERISAMKISMPADSYNWYRYFMITDPATFWAKIRVPVLILNGDRDLQVNPDINTTAIAAALDRGGNNMYRVVVLPGLNHLFQHCETGLPGEYGEIEETFSEEVLAIISDWIRER